jgi:hypothetical protein
MRVLLCHLRGGIEENHENLRIVGVSDDIRTCPLPELLGPETIYGDKSTVSIKMAVTFGWSCRAHNDLHSAYSRVLGAGCMRARSVNLKVC